MTLTRRQFAMAALAAPAAAALPIKLHADGHAAAAAPALFDAPLGAYRITALLDGMAPLQRAMFNSPDPAEIDAVLAGAGIGPDALPAPVNAFLLSSADRTILIDAGMGAIEMMGPGFGRMTAGLAAAGVSADDIDTVLVTHMHPDHIGGLLGEGGAPAFANAEIVIAEAEAGFWTDDGIASQAPAEAQGLFQMAKGIVGSYGDQVTLVGDGAEVAPSVTLHLSPGHTPGHSTLRIDGGERQLLMVADTIHNAVLHTALPDITFGFDTDSALAGQSRRKVFDMVSADKMLIAGTHLPFPGFGRILKADDSYSYLPASWL